jgi:parallel beta-helix repeat protein
MNPVRPLSTTHGLYDRILKYHPESERTGLRPFTFLIVCLILGALSARAQPSGGPYGPIPQTYELPKVSGTIFYVAPDGKAEATGESLERPTTIESAIERVKTGDAIVMRGGTYRTGNLILNQGITIQPYRDEQPVLKGTYVATEWKDLHNGLWKTSWTHLFPAKPDPWWSRDRFGKETPLYRFNNDMVFVDGRMLHAVGWEGEVNKDSYYIEYGSGQVYIGTDPTSRLMEITAFDVAIDRTTGECHGKTSDHKGPVIRGIAFTQYAYRALEVEGKEAVGVTPESEFGKDVVGTTLEDCSFTYCSRVAAYLRGDRLTMIHCKVSDTRTEGIYIISSSDVLLEKNVFSRNNIEPFAGYYPAAVKIFDQSHRVTCKDNLIIDLPNSNGIWYDVGEVDGKFIDNWVEGVGNVRREFSNDRPYPSSNGLFFEISKGIVCAGNVFVNCDQGIFILNSSNAKIYQNTFVNSTACIARNGRTPGNDKLFGWHSSTGPDVDKRGGHVFENNLLTGDANYRRPLLFVWQPDTLCSELNTPELNEFDHNVFVRKSDNEPLVLWSPAKGNACQAAFYSVKDVRSMYPDFCTQSQYYADDIPLFKSPVLRNYQLLPAFPGSQTGSLLPVEIRKLLGISGKGEKYVGAYPSER